MAAQSACKMNFKQSGMNLQKKMELTGMSAGRMEENLEEWILKGREMNLKGMKFLASFKKFV